MDNAKKHTPGPWIANEGSYGNYIKVTANQSTVARIPWGKPDTEYDNANAKLIAAAPDLLNVLERILYAHDNHGNGAAMGEAKLCQSYAEMARHVIRKVTK